MQSEARSQLYAVPNDCRTTCLNCSFSYDDNSESTWPILCIIECVDIKLNERPSPFHELASPVSRENAPGDIVCKSEDSVRIKLETKKLFYLFWVKIVQPKGHSGRGFVLFRFVFVPRVVILMYALNSQVPRRQIRTNREPKSCCVLSWLLHATEWQLGDKTQHVSQRFQSNSAISKKNKISMTFFWFVG